MYSVFNNIDKKKKKPKKSSGTTKKIEENADEKQDVEKESNVPQIPRFGDTEEWDVMEDEEKEIDLQKLRIANLNMAETNDQGSSEKDKDAKDGDSSNGGGEKPAWNAKKEDEEIEEEKPEIEATVELAKPKLFLPMHLRNGGGNPKSLKSKPKLDSAEEFPTLGCVAERNAQEKANKASQRAEIALLADTSQGKWQAAGKTNKSGPVRIDTNSTLETAFNAVPTRMDTNSTLASAFNTSGNSGGASSSPWSSSRKDDDRFRPSYSKGFGGARGSATESSTDNASGPPRVGFKINPEKLEALRAKREAEEKERELSILAAHQRLAELEKASGMSPASSVSVANTAASGRNLSSSTPASTPKKWARGGNDVTPRASNTPTQSKNYSFNRKHEPKAEISFEHVNRFAALEELN